VFIQDSLIFLSHINSLLVVNLLDWSLGGKPTILHQQQLHTIHLFLEWKSMVHLFGHATLRG